MLSALAIGLFVTERRRAVRAPALAPIAVPQAELAAWSGSLALDGGARLALRLSPLQPDPRRQAFDAARLAQRLELGPAEPWRLEVTLERTGAPLSGAAVEVALEGVRVIDREGVVSRALTTGATGPLATLLRSDAQATLEAGCTVQLVLWGREPHGSPRVGGLEVLAPSGSGIESRTIECALTTLELHEAELPASVARRR
ncbi:hypothetical protein [Planctomycetes bacterium Pla163]|uniref:hypothetical protein n=1 Tax=Rohdeia mirabilis TaxID=2528008 RepID=UPI0011A39A8A